MANAEGFCLVRCPNCLNILPEPHNVTVYTCGGCGTTLRAKICASNGQHVAVKQARQDSDSYSVATVVSNGQPFQTKSKAQRAPSMLMLLASSMEATGQGRVKMVTMCWLGRMLWWFTMLRARKTTLWNNLHGIQRPSKK